jgi:hypothetical protein
VRARDLQAGDVIEVLGEALRVAAPVRIAGNTAIVETTAGVTVYLRAAGAAPLARPPEGHRATR